MTRSNCLCSLSVLLLCCGVPGKSYATSITVAGSLTSDDSVIDYTFTNPSTQTLDFYTTSYVGGTNANRTVTAAGGFDPVLTLFSNSTGLVIGFGGGEGVCGGGATADPATKLCNDANFSKLLAAGTYTLALSEFPNVPTGDLSAPGFLANGDPTFTGDNCGVSGGKFLEADLAPCVQRDANYAFNIASPVAVATPEPATWLLMLPAFAGLACLKLRQIAA